ncbi:hypothetical protein [Enterococcus faecium]|uniref:hypothetical protein n=1 Tax=Enterococcus faecium TaxID=1352 RepID=UPI000E04E71E|nr:hypothetical protein [Enterococcus faecium]RBT08222.1 hypothetical protein EA87_00965 [Enterococcus faecium]
MSEFKEKVLSEISFAMVDDAPDLQKLYDKVAAIDEHPELNDNQQIVLQWLKYPLNGIPNRFAKNYFAYVTCLFLGQAPDKVLKAYQELSLEQRRQVLAALAQWGLKQEEAE